MKEKNRVLNSKELDIVSITLMLKSWQINMPSDHKLNQLKE